MRKYVVPVYWTVSASVIVEAEDSHDAGVLAEEMNAAGHSFDHEECSPGSFEVAFDCIEPIVIGERELES